MTDASGVQTSPARALHLWRAALAGAVIGLALGSIPFAVDAYNEGRPYGYQIHRLPVWLKQPMLPGLFVAYVVGQITNSWIRIPMGIAAQAIFYGSLGVVVRLAWIFSWQKFSRRAK